jgi:hypothetical protein
MKKILIGTLAFALLNASIYPLRAHGAEPVDERNAHENQSAPQEACSARVELNVLERQALGVFNAKLSHLRRDYGTRDFNPALAQIVRNSWPHVVALEVSPLVFEKARIMVEQARLRHAISLTIGLESQEWVAFAKHMDAITLSGEVSSNRTNPFERASTDLMNALAHRSREGGPRRVLREPRNVRAFAHRFTDAEVEAKQQAWEARNAEAIARTAEMYIALVKWRAINGQIQFEAAEASARTVAVIAIGAMGAGVLYSTLVISAPIVTFAGATSAELAGSTVIAPLIVKVAEAAAGAGIGMIGAPAAHILADSYGVLSDAAVHSANRQSNYLCELARRMRMWREAAPTELGTAALIGSGMGMGGGMLTFTAKSARAVLLVTGFGVGIAQLYAVGALGWAAIESLKHYKLAEEAETSGDHERALAELYKARDFAQQAGEHLLEGVIIGTLSYHVSHNFKAALRDGESAIRQLYAASADTLPTAGNAVVQVATKLASMSGNLSAQLTQLKALTVLVSKSAVLSPTVQVVVKDRKTDLQRDLHSAGVEEDVDQLLRLSPAELRRISLEAQQP